MDAGLVTGGFGQPHAKRRPSAPDPDRDVAVQLYTTGTTGMPKGVMLTHGNLRFGGQASVPLRDMVSEDITYGALPIIHVFGLASVMTAALYRVASVRFDPGSRPPSSMRRSTTGSRCCPRSRRCMRF